MTATPTQLWVNDALVDVPSSDPNQSLLGFLRDSAGLVGTKEGCASGDCGACTVVVIDPIADDVRTINSCITPLGAVLDSQVVTVEGVGSNDALHPVQAAMVNEHGSQCGFCTPGFVMSLVGRQLQAESGADLARMGREDLVRAISGNLCRCTGYRPILSAAQRANEQTAEQYAEDTRASIPCVAHRSAPRRPQGQLASYHRPTTEAELQGLLSTGLPIVAGSTDLWLAVTQRYEDFPGFIDITGIAELRDITVSDSRLCIGAGATHAQLEAFFGATPFACEAIQSMLRRFGSPQIRSRATLGGNIANASPIADWPPLLMACDANVLIRNAGGASRSVPLTEFYLGYKQTALGEQEYIAGIDIDAQLDFAKLQAFKISKRTDDDISSTFGAFLIDVVDGVTRTVRVAFGGVAATPVRTFDVEQTLLQQPLTPASIDAAAAVLAAALQPITDVRASANYRREVSVALLRKALAVAAGDAPDTPMEFAGE